MIKKVFLMLGIAAMLASCSQNEELFSDKGNNTVQQVRLSHSQPTRSPKHELPRMACVMWLLSMMRLVRQK